jgi:hypothetical protein
MATMVGVGSFPNFRPNARRKPSIVDVWPMKNREMNRNTGL